MVCVRACALRSVTLCDLYGAGAAFASFVPVSDHYANNVKSATAHRPSGRPHGAQSHRQVSGARWRVCGPWRTVFSSHEVCGAWQAPCALQFMLRYVMLPVSQLSRLDSLDLPAAASCLGVLGQFRSPLLSIARYLPPPWRVGASAQEEPPRLQCRDSTRLASRRHSMVMARAEWDRLVLVHRRRLQPRQSPAQTARAEQLTRCNRESLATSCASCARRRRPRSTLKAVASRHRSDLGTWKSLVRQGEYAV